MLHWPGYRSLENTQGEEIYQKNQKCYVDHSRFLTIDFFFLKVVDVKIDRENPYLGFIPIRFADKGSYVHSHTKEYDALAFKYLSWALYPLLIGYSIYSLIYEEHKGWYSWVLSMLYGFLLTFGELLYPIYPFQIVKFNFI